MARATSYYLSVIAVAVFAVVAIGLCIWFYMSRNRDANDTFANIDKDALTLRFIELDPVIKLTDEALKAGLHSQYAYYKLDNGLDVVFNFCENTSTLTATAQIFTGMALDPDEYREIAHLTEHLVLVKTKNLRTINAVLDYLPGSNYGTTCTESDKVNIEFKYSPQIDETEVTMQHMSKLLYVLKECVYNADFNIPEFESEKAIVLNEFNKSTREYKHDWTTNRILYGSHPYGKYYGDHTKADGQAITAKVVTDYYKANYRPDNMRIVIHGNIPGWPTNINTSNNSFDTLGRLITDYFIKNTDSEWQLPSSQATPVTNPPYKFTTDLATIRTWTNELRTRVLRKYPPIKPITDGPRIYTLTDSNLLQSHVYFRFVIPSVYNELVFTYNDVIVSILNTKLFYLLRDTSRLVYYVSASCEVQLRDRANIIETQVAAADIHKLTEAMFQVFNEMKEGYYFTEEDIKKYKSTNGKPADTCSSTDDNEYFYMFNALTLIDPKTSILDAYDNMTSSNLNYVAKQLFNPENLAIFVYKPTEPANQERFPMLVNVSRV